MSKIHFKTKPSKVGAWDIVHLPKSASELLPSRGIVFVKGSLNGSRFETVLEPDGKKSHWFKLDKDMKGSNIEVEFEPSKDWPEPNIPDDLGKALKGDKSAYQTWMDITPMSRWEWIRWIRSTKNPETRKVRIEKTFSKFRSGKRSPCCFNRTECTVPEVSNKGMLIATI